jgi:hypothetical protein
MALALRSGLHHCRFEAEYVFFDLSVDRYFLLSGVAAHRFGRFVSGRASADDHEHLLSHDLLVEVPDEEMRGGRTLPAATASLIDTPVADAPFGTAVASLLAQWRARRDLGRCRLADIVCTFGDECIDISPGMDEICGEIAAAFLRARLYASATDQCLVRGIAMKRMLMRRGCAASLAFGVTMPFAAHCWVQTGETVLTDPLDIVLHYQPIFAV